MVTVGAGGSLGREGPMIRLGAMMSTWLGTCWGLAPHRVKILLGCGAAAGLAAAYNVPIGGALFAMEVILGNFALEIFGPIVAASVISTLISRGISGDVPRYELLDYSLVSGWEILAYAGLGILGGFASVAFIRGVRLAGRGFAAVPFVPIWAKPALGMALLGALAVSTPQILDGGHETSRATLSGQLPLTLLLWLAVAKLLATALTAGSGNAGGLFTPSLFFGAAVGGAYGYGIHALWPAATAGYGAYAAVGMAAVTAGTSHAPISAILILFELTGNYELILPLMVASILASLVARKLTRSSLYTESLEKRGIDTNWRMEEAVLAGLAVRDLARADSDTLAPGEGYADLVETFLATHRQRLFVIAPDGRLLGAVSLHDIKHALDDPGRLTAVVAHDLMVPVDRALREDDRLHRAAEVFARSEFERLPVVDEEGRFRGVLAKRDLLAIYAQEVLGRPAMLATFVSGNDAARRDYVELPPDFSLRLVPVPAGLVGKTLADARLPQTLGARVLEIQRTGRAGEVRRVIPEGATVLAAGDRLIVLAPEQVVERIEAGKLVLDEADHMHAID